MGADDMATQGARASETMILLLLNWGDSVPACSELNYPLKNIKISTTCAMLVMRNAKKFKYDWCKALNVHIEWLKISKFNKSELNFPNGIFRVI